MGDSKSSSAAQRACAAAEDALSAVPHNHAASFCKATALSRLGEFQAAVGELHDLLNLCVEDLQLRVQASALLVRCLVLDSRAHADVVKARNKALQVCETQSQVNSATSISILALELDLLTCMSEVQHASGLAACASKSLCDQQETSAMRPSIGRLSREASDTLWTPSCVTTDEVDELPGSLDVTQKLSWVITHAELMDLPDVLWQALAWRCRAHLVSSCFDKAVQDATDA